MRDVVRWIDRAFCGTVEAVAMLCMAVYASLCFYQVLARFLINAPATWTESLTRALMIWSVYLGAVALFRRGLLISVDYLHSMTTGWRRRALDLFHFMAAFLVLGVASYYGFQLVWRVRFQIMAGVNVSIAYAYLAVPVGALFCIVGLIAHHIELARGTAQDATPIE
ncbi:TRAP transporter small permease [Acuticoccus kandeliae]|uniref:TRAP transporter small permease n=1 Tax=Acuticoccus kandeliae TaxID=2073160 RepID=UPI001300504A|nr:TRAP transporter small permease subunit [Acuticoccus kandeliae]